MIINRNIIFRFALVLVLFLPVVSGAKVGVGLGNGKIDYTEPMRAGSIYTLPVMSVINNGDETATYGIKVEYKSKPDRLVPGRDWFTFSPDKFVIEPGKAQMVNVKMTVPIKAVPGDYFCFLSAFPIQGSTPGSTAVGIAVASKLFFTIAPSNIFVGIYYRVASLIVRYAPWTYIVFGVIILAIFLKFVGRFISVDIGIKKKK